MTHDSLNAAGHGVFVACLTPFVTRSISLSCGELQGMRVSILKLWFWPIWFYWTKLWKKNPSTRDSAAHYSWRRLVHIWLFRCNAWLFLLSWGKKWTYYFFFLLNFLKVQSEVIGFDHDGTPLTLTVCPMWYLAFSMLFGALCAVFLYYVIITRNYFMERIMMKPEGWVSSCIQVLMNKIYFY